MVPGKDKSGCEYSKAGSEHLTFTKNRFTSCLSPFLSLSYASQEQCVLLSHESLLKLEPHSSAHQSVCICLCPTVWDVKSTTKSQANSSLAPLNILQTLPFTEYLEGRGPGPKPTGNRFTSLATPVCQGRASGLECSFAYIRKACLCKWQMTWMSLARVESSVTSSPYLGLWLLLTGVT